jgi:hypothetical protein
LPDGPYALDEAASVLAGAAQGLLAPEDAAAAYAFSVVLGRRHPIGHHETPASRFSRASVSPAVGDLGIGASAACIEHAM